MTRHRTLALALTACFVVGCAGPEPGAVAPSLATRTGLAMGAQLRVSAIVADPVAAEAAFDAVFAEFERLEARLSIWKPGSDVQAINAGAGAAAVAVGPDLIATLKAARQVSEWTEGKFDVTFGALTDVWKFDHDQDRTVPTDEQIALRRALIDYKAVTLDEAGQTVRLARPGMRVHLGGVGKGYAVERGAHILRERGFTDFIVQSGGDLYVGGLRQGAPWRLGIADPRHPSHVFGTVDLSDATLSTSGDYERAFVRNGTRYHHILDPHTGQPARGCRSVTIVTKSPLLADALSTGVFVLGPDKGMALVERLPDVEAVIVTDGNQVLVSTGLRDRFRQLTAPTDGV